LKLALLIDFRLQLAEFVARRITLACHAGNVSLQLSALFGESAIFG
jgi:hypothetical protein